ncbi:MAG: hypothetical protein ACXW5W_09400 [Candidatus Binatia bacterium]
MEDELERILQTPSEVRISRSDHYDEMAALSRLEDAIAGSESMRPLYSSRISPTVEGMRNTLRILSRADPKFNTLKAEDLIDDRIIRRLQDEGLFK